MNKQQERLEKAVKKVQTKLGTNFNLFYTELPEDDAFLRIGRTERGSADPISFILYYSPENVDNRTDKQLTRDVFHELLHCVTWPLEDIFQKTLPHVKNKEVKKELKQLFDDNTEAVTYFLERSTGKHLFPSIDWTED